jgi:hypothetical protein
VNKAEMTGRGDALYGWGGAVGKKEKLSVSVRGAAREHGGRNLGRGVTKEVR